MPRVYQYVGSKDILLRTVAAPAGIPIASAADFTAWVHDTRQHPNRAGLVVVTFVVDEQEWGGIVEVAVARVLPHLAFDLLHDLICDSKLSISDGVGSRFPHEVEMPYAIIFLLGLDWPSTPA